MSLETLENHERAGKKVPNTRVYSLALEAMLQGKSKTKKGFEKKDVERFRPSKEKLPYWIVTEESFKIIEVQRSLWVKMVEPPTPSLAFF